MCLTLPPDAHADFATLYVICAHCNLLSVRIERVFRRPAMIRNQFRHSIYPGISKRIAWQKKRRMWKIAESRNERTKIPRRIEILCRDYRNIITRKIRFEEEGKGKRTLRNNYDTKSCSSSVRSVFSKQSNPREQTIERNGSAHVASKFDESSHLCAPHVYHYPSGSSFRPRI